MVLKHIGVNTLLKSIVVRCCIYDFSLQPLLFSFMIYFGYGPLLCDPRHLELEVETLSCHCFQFLLEILAIKLLVLLSVENNLGIRRGNALEICNVEIARCQSSFKLPSLIVSLLSFRPQGLLRR